MTKKALYSLLTVGVLFTAAVAAQAQQEINLKADVPFAFTVADKTLPAGHYNVTEPANGVLRVCAEDCVGITAMNIGWTHDNSDTKLVFRRYGDQYFLSQAWMHDQGRGISVNRSKREKKLATSQAPEVIEIAALR